MAAKEKLKNGMNEPAIRVSNAVLGLAVIGSLLSAVGLADPLIAFLSAERVSLGDLGTASNGLVLGLAALIISFLRNEASYSDFSTIQRILYGLGTVGFLSVFLSETVNTAVSGDPRIGIGVVAIGIVYHYGVSAADVLGARLNN